MTKLNFTDYTFIIPFHYDIPDRLENINLSIDYLYSRVNSTIYVKEMGEKRYFNYTRHKDKDNFIYEYVNAKFSKTSLINSMVSLVDTKYFSIHDTDSFLTINQLREVYKIFSLDIVDCIVPYNGLYLEIPRDSINKIPKVNDISDIDGICTSRFLEKDYKGTGCCVFFKTETFKKIGGMNENFIKWGHEDDEIVYRIFGTGNNIIWLNKKGPIHHLSHGHSTDGFGFEHTHDMSKKQLEELNKIKTLNLYNLLEYVKTW